MAAELALKRQWNRAVVYREGRVLSVPLSEIQGDPRQIPSGHRWLELAQSLGIYFGQ
jgi:hypothetical protein